MIFDAVATWFNERRIQILEDCIGLFEEGKGLMGSICGILFFIAEVGIIILKYVFCYWLWLKIVVESCGGPSIGIVKFLGLVLLLKIVMYKLPQKNQNIICVPASRAGEDDK